MRALTPIQMARVFMASYPYNPGELAHPKGRHVLLGTE